MIPRALALFAALLASASVARAADFRIEDVNSLGAVGAADLKPLVIAFTDHRKDDLADQVTGLVKCQTA